MIFIIISIIGMFVYGIYEDGLGLGIFGGFIGVIVGLVLYYFVGGTIGYFLPMTDTFEEHELYALNDSSSIEGVKYLFSGYIDEELVCRYVINTEKGKHIEEEKTDNVYIKEGNYIPTVKIHRNDLKKDWHYWFAHPLFNEDYYIEFFVPENTVTSEYKIDLK